MSKLDQVRDEIIKNRIAAGFEPETETADFWFTGEGPSYGRYKRSWRFGEYPFGVTEETKNRIIESEYVHPETGQTPLQVWHGLTTHWNNEVFSSEFAREFCEHADKQKDYPVHFAFRYLSEELGGGKGGIRYLSEELGGGKGGIRYFVVYFKNSGTRFIVNPKLPEDRNGRRQAGRTSSRTIYTSKEMCQNLQRYYNLMSEPCEVHRDNKGKFFRITFENGDSDKIIPFSEAYKRKTYLNDKDQQDHDYILEISAQVMKQKNKKTNKKELYQTRLATFGVWAAKDGRKGEADILYRDTVKNDRVNGGPYKNLLSTVVDKCFKKGGGDMRLEPEKVYVCDSYITIDFKDAKTGKSSYPDNITMFRDVHERS